MPDPSHSGSRPHEDRTSNAGGRGPRRSARLGRSEWVPAQQQGRVDQQMAGAARIPLLRKRILLVAASRRIGEATGLDGQSTPWQTPTTKIL